MTEEEKKDCLITDTVLRVAAIEQLLIKKGLLTETEVAEAYATAVSNLKSILELSLKAEK